MRYLPKSDAERREMLDSLGLATLEDLFTHLPKEVRLDRAGVPERTRGRAVELPVVVTVPMSRLALVPRGAQHVGQLSLFLAAADEDGAVSTVTEVRLPLRVANDQLSAALGQLATYRTRLGLKRGTPLIARFSASMA